LHAEAIAELERGVKEEQADGVLEGVQFIKGAGLADHGFESADHGFESADHGFESADHGFESIQAARRDVIYSRQPAFTVHQFGPPYVACFEVEFATS